MGGVSSPRNPGRLVSLYLHSLTAEGSLEEILEAAQPSLGDGAMALCYAPNDCSLARLTGGRLHRPGGAIDPSGLFELRAFGGGRELRWLHEDGGRGTAALFWDSKGKAHATLPGSSERADRRMLACRTHRYLLWGAAMEGAPQGWTTLREERIDPFYVPITGLATGSRVGLEAVEYLEERVHGNVVVAEERLAKLVPADSETRDD